MSSYGNFSLITPENKYRKTGAEKVSFPGTPGSPRWDMGALDPMWVTKNPSREPWEQSLSLIFPFPSVWPAVWGKAKMSWVV